MLFRGYKTTGETTANNASGKSALFFTCSYMQDWDRKILDELNNNGKLWCWCANYLSLHHHDEYEVTPFQFEISELFRLCLYELAFLEFAAFNSLHRETLACNFEETISYLKIMPEEARATQMKFNLMSYDESSKTFAFPDQKLCNFFAARYIFSCYQAKRHLHESNEHHIMYSRRRGHFDHQWLLSSDSVENYILKLQDDESRMDVCENMFNISRELSDNELTVFLNNESRAVRRKNLVDKMNSLQSDGYRFECDYTNKEVILIKFILQLRDYNRVEEAVTKLANMTSSTRQLFTEYLMSLKAMPDQDTEIVCNLCLDEMKATGTISINFQFHAYDSIQQALIRLVNAFTDIKCSQTLSGVRMH